MSIDEFAGWLSHPIGYTTKIRTNHAYFVIEPAFIANG